MKVLLLITVLTACLVSSTQIILIQKIKTVDTQLDALIKVSNEISHTLEQQKKGTP